MADDKPGSWKDGLEPKQIRFVEEYLVDLNATQAAIRAGYSSIKTSAASLGYQNLRKPAVAAAVAKAMAEGPGVTQTRIVDELASVGFANMLDFVTVQKDGTAYVDLSKITREQAAAIGELSSDELTEGRGEDARQIKRVKIKLIDKLTALEKIGKVLRMFTEKHEITGKDGEAFAPEAGTRDVARAVLDILRTAKTQEPES